LEKPDEFVIDIPEKINTVIVDEKFLVENLGKYDLFVNPYPLIPN